VRRRNAGERGDGEVAVSEDEKMRPMMAKRLLVFVLTLLVGRSLWPGCSGCGGGAAHAADGGLRQQLVLDILTSGIANHTFTYGLAGDVQLLADWDGDGDATLGMVRGSTRYLRTSNTP
jgi:hypothetical protein